MHEPAVDDFRESFIRFSEAERDFRITESVLLLGRPLNQESIAATTAQVFGKLLAYLAAGRDFHHADARFMQEAFLGKKKKGAAGMIVENLHQTLDRAFTLEEEFRLEKITYRILLLVDGAARRDHSLSEEERCL